MVVGRLKLGIVIGALACWVACSVSEDEGSADHHDDGAVDDVVAGFGKTDPVSRAVTEACSTAAVAGLSAQLVAEIQCMRQDVRYERIDDQPRIRRGAAFPILQGPVAEALIAAQRERGVELRVNSGLRTLADQYILYRWYQLGRCGIALAAKPGTSNHESGLSVDIADNAAWRGAMQRAGFKWLGANDAVHFDYAGRGTFDMRGLSVRAFQRLWNRNNPQDRIPEDGVYGAPTQARLAKAPVGGFAGSSACSTPGRVDDAGIVDAASDAGTLFEDASRPVEDAGRYEDAIANDAGRANPDAAATIESADESAQESPRRRSAATETPPSSAPVSNDVETSLGTSGCALGGGAASSGELLTMVVLVLLRQRRRTRRGRELSP